jgi:hypothetical protein
LGSHDRGGSRREGEGGEHDAADSWTRLVVALYALAALATLLYTIGAPFYQGG